VEALVKESISDEEDPNCVLLLHLRFSAFPLVGEASLRMWNEGRSSGTGETKATVETTSKQLIVKDSRSNFMVGSADYEVALQAEEQIYMETEMMF
jgi:hypothetical protein